MLKRGTHFSSLPVRSSEVVSPGLVGSDSDVRGNWNQRSLVTSETTTPGFDYLYGRQIRRYEGEIGFDGVRSVGVGVWMDVCYQKGVVSVRHFGSSLRRKFTNLRLCFNVSCVLL